MKLYFLHWWLLTKKKKSSGLFPTYCILFARFAMQAHMIALLMDDNNNGK